MKENNILEMMIVNNEDIKDADFYLEIKGKDLYMHVIKIFKDRFKEKKFNYKEISSYIRYDKALRDILFSYFALLEEHLRSKLWNVKDIIKSTTLDFVERKNNNISNLYFYIIKNENKITFSKLIKLLEKEKIINLKEIKDLKSLIVLRNEIMHHNLLLIQNFITWEDVAKNINKLAKNLKILLEYLPVNYQKGFIDRINNLNRCIKKTKKEKNYIKQKLTDLKYFTRINLKELDYYEY